MSYDQREVKRGPSSSLKIAMCYNLGIIPI